MLAGGWRPRRRAYALERFRALRVLAVNLKVRDGGLLVNPERARRAPSALPSALIDEPRRTRRSRRNHSRCWLAAGGRGQNPAYALEPFRAFFVSFVVNLKVRDGGVAGES